VPVVNPPGLAATIRVFSGPCLCLFPTAPGLHPPDGPGVIPQTLLRRVCRAVAAEGVREGGPPHESPNAPAAFSFVGAVLASARISSRADCSRCHRKESWTRDFSATFSAIRSQSPPPHSSVFSVVTRLARDPFRSRLPAAAPAEEGRIPLELSFRSASSFLACLADVGQRARITPLPSLTVE
jgi:hypothetical protein